MPVRKRITIEDTTTKTLILKSAKKYFLKYGYQAAPLRKIVCSFGLYLDLEASGISGGVPMSLLPADYYLLNKHHHQLIGEQHGRIFQLGDVVQARLESADITTRRLVFSLA